MTALTTQTVTSVVQYQSMRDDLLALFHRSGVPFSAVAHPDWIVAWWRSRPPHRSLLCCMIFDGGRLVGSVPMEFVQRYHLPVRKATSSNLAWGWSSALIDPGAGDWAPAFLDWLGEDVPPWAVTEFGLFSEDSTVWPALRDQRRWHATHITRGIAGLDLPQSFERFLATRSKNLRRKIRRTENAATELHRVVTEAPDASLLDHVIGTVSAHSWQGQAGAAVYADSENQDFYRLLAAHPGDLRLVLHHAQTPDGTPVAYLLSVQVEDVMHHIDTGFDARFAQVSPGLLVTLDAIEWACGQGLARVDLGIDADYKARFGTVVQTAHGVLFTRGLGGAVARVRAKP